MKYFRRIPDWGWLALLATVLRLVTLARDNLWYDETYTAWVAKLDFSHMMAAIQSDVHPPLWYFIERLTIQALGSSTFALRLPAMILSVLAVVLVWRLAVDVGMSRRTAFVAGILAAILPASIYYGQDARMYPMLACCVLLAMHAAIHKRWQLFTIASVGAVYSQNLGLFYVFAVGIVVLMANRRTRRDLINPIAALMAIIACWLPWSLITLRQAQAIGSGYWIQPLTVGAAFFPLPLMTMGWTMPDALQIHIYGAAIGISCVGLIASRRWLMSRPGAIVLAGLLGAPVVMIAVSLVWRSIYLPRALLPSTLALTLVWAYALEHLSIPNRRIARLIVVPMLAVSLVYYYFPDQYNRENVQEWLAPVNAQWQPGDVVYHTAIPTVIAFTYYLPRPYELRPSTSDLRVAISEQTKTAMGIQELPFDDLAGQGYKRAWVIVYINPVSDQAEYDEIEQITHAYPTRLIKQRTTPFTDEAIYLVDLSL